LFSAVFPQCRSRPGQRARRNERSSSIPREGFASFNPPSPRPIHLRSQETIARLSGGIPSGNFPAKKGRKRFSCRRLAISGSSLRPALRRSRRFVSGHCSTYSLSLNLVVSAPGAHTRHCALKRAIFLTTGENMKLALIAVPLFSLMLASAEDKMLARDFGKMSPPTGCRVAQSRPSHRPVHSRRWLPVTWQSRLAPTCSLRFRTI
jgi:hypothetical protein